MAALGNVVSQLHIHHIARYHNDPAWPRPVWGVVDSKNYTDTVREQRVSAVQELLKGKEFSAE